MLFVVGYVQRLAAKEAVEGQIAQLQAEIERPRAGKPCYWKDRRRSTTLPTLPKSRVMTWVLSKRATSRSSSSTPVTAEAPAAAPSAARTPVITEPNWRALAGSGAAGWGIRVTGGNV